MAADPLGPGLSLIALFVLGGLVRAAEAALPGVDEGELKKSDAPAARRALKLAELGEDRFGSLFMTHAFLTLAACAVAELWLARPLGEWLAGLLPGLSEGASLALGAALVLLAFSLAYFVAGHLIPAAAAAHAPEKTLNRTASAAWVLSRALLPLTAAAAALTRLILKPFGVDPASATESVTEEEIRAMVDMGEEKGTIEADEKQMIENIFEFNNLDAEDCMIHRKDIIAIDVEDTHEEILRTIEESGLSRFPVYEDNIDNILGILISRDYLLNACNQRGKTLKDMIRPAYFVPESVHSDVLFHEMQTRKQHIAIVVDEYGGTSGLVTLEDLLEEIVGNIYDEFDPKEEQDIIPLGDGRCRVSGSAELEALGEVLGVEFPEQDEFDTVGGLVYSQLTEIPADGDQPTVECFGLRIRVEEISDRRVEWALVEKLPEEKKD